MVSSTIPVGNAMVQMLLENDPPSAVFVAAIDANSHLKTIGSTLTSIVEINADSSEKTIVSTLTGIVELASY